MLLLCIFIVASLLFGSYPIGPFSIRVYATIFLIGYILYLKFKKKEEVTLPLNYVNIYVLFLVVTCLIKLLTEPDGLSEYIKDVFALHLVAITAYFGVAYFVKTEKQLTIVLSLLTFIGFANSIVSILQINGHPLGYAVAKFFYPLGQSLSELEDDISNFDFGDVVVQGIFGTGAYNGISNALLAILSMYFMFKKGVTKYVSIIICVVMFMGCFYIQQRAAMGLLIVGILLAIWRFSPKKYLLLAVLVGCLAFAFTNTSVDIESFGRLQGMFELDAARERAYSRSLNFISDNLFLGGEMKFFQIHHGSPHNFIFASLIMSGLLGSIIIFYLFVKMFIISSKIIFRCDNSPEFYLGCASLTYLCNSFFHTTSLVRGDVIYWIVFALMLRSEQLSKSQMN